MPALGKVLHFQPSTDTLCKAAADMSPYLQSLSIPHGQGLPYVYWK